MAFGAVLARLSASAAVAATSYKISTAAYAAIVVKRKPHTKHKQDIMNVGRDRSNLTKILVN